MRLYLIFIFLILFPVKNTSQGLQFQGYGILMEERSSYSVFENDIPQFEDQFTIEFNISFHNPEAFGYIFLLKDEDSGLKYNLTYSFKEGLHSFLKFNKEGKDNLLTIPIENEILNNRTWFNVVCTFFLNHDSVSITMNDRTTTAQKLNLPGKVNPRLYFGKNENSVDVASYSIRNLKITGGKKHYYFPLNESEGNKVHSSNGKTIGHITNPVWLINTSYYWKPLFTYHSKKVTGTTYCPSSQSILFFDKDSITELYVKTNTTTTQNYKNPFPILNMRLGLSFLDQNENLYAYEVCDYTPERIDTTVARLNRKDNSWTALKPEALPIQLHHHAGYFDPEKSRYILFGGFGNERYNDLFFSYEIQTNQWTTINFRGDKIPARFFQGITKRKNKNELLIFGGMGNESGDQTVGRQNFYDLYRIDLNNYEIKKCWELDWDRKNVVPARNMVMIEDTHFYALCYPEYEPDSFLQLYRFSIKDGSYEIVGDSIPIRSDKIATNANLYYNENLQEFYCIAQEFEDDGSSGIYIYSISAPPVTRATLNIYPIQNKNNFLYWLLSVLFLCGTAYLVYFYYKKQGKGQQPLLFKTKNLPLNEKLTQDDKPNSIYLFGEFTVYDKSGKDITYMFSPRIKEVLLLLLHHSLKNGLSTQKLSESFWADKSGTNLKNVRGVTLNHLRKLIAELQGIELMYEKGYFRLILSENCYCDYYRFSQLINSGTSGHTENQLPEFAKILSRGKFLTSFDSPLFDSFKEKTENTILSILPIDMETTFKKQNYRLVLCLAEILLLTDPLCEEALYYQIHSFIKLRQKTEARKKYALFITEYKKAMEEEFSLTFDDILKTKMR